MMPGWLRLRLAVPLLVLAVGLLVTALLLAIELRQTNDRAVSIAVRQLGLLSDIIVESVEKTMRRGDVAALADALGPIRANRAARSAVIVDDENRALVATDRTSELADGKSVIVESPLIDTARRSGRSQYRLDESGTKLLWAHPFSMPPAAGELLPSRSGVLFVRYNLDISRYESLRDAFARSNTALLMIGLVCVLVTWFFFRVFTPRINELVRSTEQIASGDYKAVPAIGGSDELARIGRAISEMAARLAREHDKLAESEADLRRLNAELEMRVADRTAEAIGYALDMEAFAFMISHDLRTPLRSIAGFAQLLAQDHAATIGQEGLENLGRVLLNAKRMNRLMDDILSLSRGGRQPLQTSSIDMAALARSVASEILGDNVDASRIRITIDDVPAAVGDESLVRQAIQNLLSNAVKYSGIRETAEIRFGATSDARGTIYYVSDNGIGFAMKYAVQIFAPFKRLVAPSEYEGTGVGLAIVKRVFERHGGSVWVRSQFGTGTTFYFTFFKAAEASELVQIAEADSYRRVGEVAAR